MKPARPWIVVGLMTITGCVELPRWDQFPKKALPAAAAPAPAAPINADDVSEENARDKALALEAELSRDQAEMTEKPAAKSGPATCASVSPGCVSLEISLPSIIVEVSRKPAAHGKTLRPAL